jgi:ferredoxin
MKAPKLPSIKPYISEQDTPIPAGEKAHVGLSVPEIVFAYAQMSTKVKSSYSIAHLIIGSFLEAKKSCQAIKFNPYKNNKTITQKQLGALESYAHDLGIDQIGYTTVDTNLIFKGQSILFPNAIVLTMEMKQSEIDQAPSLAANKEIFRTYYSLGKIVNQLAAFLKNQGFNAQAGPAVGGDVNYVQLASDSSLGMIGKHGLLITENFGPSLRIAAIYTDIENLPAPEENSHQWIRAFCQQCNACVKACPANAIYENPIVYEDFTEQHIDYEKCALPFANNYGCTLCVKNCAFYKNDYQKIKAAFH